MKYLSGAPWYFLSSIITKLMGFALLPIYTKIFAQAEIGALSVYESSGRILFILISLYLDASFLRFYYKIRNDETVSINVYFSTHFWFIVLWGGIISLFLMMFLDNLLPFLPKASRYAIPVLVLSQFFSQFVNLLTVVWTADLKIKLLSFFNIISSIIVFLLTVWMIAYNSGTWEHRLYAVFIVSTIQCLTVLIFAMNNKWISVNFDVQLIKQSLRYSIPLLPNVLAGWIALFSDRLIMTYYGNLDQVGVYSIAAQLALILYILNDGITKIQGPLAMSGMTDNADVAKSKMASFLYAYTSLIIFFYIICILVIPLVIIGFFDDTYNEAKNIFIILGWVYIFSGIYRVFTNVISFHNATWIISTGAIIQGTLNVGLNFALIPKFGMYAAASSTVLSMIFYTAWLIVWAQQKDKIKVNFYKILVFMLIGILSILFLNYVDKKNLNVYNALSIKIFYVINVALILCALQPIRTRIILLNTLGIKRLWKKKSY